MRGGGDLGSPSIIIDKTGCRHCFFSCLTCQNKAAARTVLIVHVHSFHWANDETQTYATTEFIAIYIQNNKTISDGGITVDFWIIKVHTSN